MIGRFIIDLSNKKTDQGMFPDPFFIHDPI
jgi:hypothetical protein